MEQPTVSAEEKEAQDVYMLERTNLGYLPTVLDSLKVTGNDFRPQLLAWVNAHTINKSLFVKRFPIEQQIGDGMSSKIYKSGSKVIRATKATGKPSDIVGKLNDLRVETEIIELVQSPYAVKLFETHIIGLTTYHVMEFADAGSLEDYIPAKGMSVNKALACMQQIFSGLAFIHSKGIVHYDIKPQNILAFKNGKLKLTDFEVSVRVVGDTPIDNGGNPRTKYFFRGSIPFMAPEVMNQGEIDDIYKLDVFSAGRVFLRLLTNHDSFNSPQTKMVLETLQSNSYTNALRIEREVKQRTCKRCKSLFRYTLQYTPTARKSASWIVNRMTSWTWRPNQYGFDDQKSTTIIEDIVKLRF